MSAMVKIGIVAEFELAEKMTALLAQSSLPIEQVVIVEATPFNEEQGVRFKNKAVEQLPLDKADWASFHYVFFAGRIQQAEWMAKAVQAGCLVFDVKGIGASLASTFVSLPYIQQHRLPVKPPIISLPNPQVSQVALAIDGLVQQQQINQIMVSSLLPASYSGQDSVEKLAGQTARLLNGIPIEKTKKRFAFDVFAAKENGLSLQLQKLFSSLDDSIFHAIQVPVFYGLSQLVTVKSDYPIDTEQLVAHWQAQPYIKYHEEQFTPVQNGELEAEQEEISLHISGLSAVENGVEFWLVADEQRFSIALMTIKLAEWIYQQGY